MRKHTGAAHAEAVALEASAAAVAVEASAAAELDATAPLPAAESVPATAASISSGVASLTRRFSVKIHPGESSSVSQVFPFAVASLS